MNGPAINDPWTTFKLWMAEAKSTTLRDPNAMVISTCDDTGQPYSRVVLCKEIRDDGLIFYTNYHSQKARQLAHNNRCAVNFFWDPLHRQVKMEGRISKVDRETSEKYWATRARESQLSQWVSKQSEVLDSRETMEKLIDEAEVQFAGKPIPCPAHWGGYLFNPTSIELWIGGKGRFHDRYAFTKVQNAWSSKRLYP